MRVVFQVLSFKLVCPSFSQPHDVAPFLLKLSTILAPPPLGVAYIVAGVQRFPSDRQPWLVSGGVENTIRLIALGKKNWLIAGGERAGKRAAAIHNLFATAKLNGIEPAAWLKDTLVNYPSGQTVASSNCSRSTRLQKLPEFYRWDGRTLTNLGGYGYSIYAYGVDGYLNRGNASR